MKRISHCKPTDETSEHSQELEGFVDMGMKRDALRLARQKLKSLAVTGDDFNSSLNAIKNLSRQLQANFDFRATDIGRLRFSCDWPAL